MKKGFTLAEVMITLTVIGIITAIVLPVAFHSKPDENVMKFKKAHNTLYKVISTLVNDEKYYQNGDLTTMAGGENATKISLCNNFADVVSAKKINCNYTSAVLGAVAACTITSASSCTSIDISPETFDSLCKQAQESFSSNDIGILTADGIYYFEAGMGDFFGCVYGQDCTSANRSGREVSVGKKLFGYDSQMDYRYFSDLGIMTLRFYKPFCIDIDGINKGEDPFGYGIRADGKIMTGARANSWLNKSIQG